MSSDGAGDDLPPEPISAPALGARIERIDRLELPTYGLELHRFRQRVTLWVLALFAASIVFDVVLGIVGATYHVDLSAVREPLHDANVALVGLTGIVIGYYFGESRR